MIKFIEDILKKYNIDKALIMTFIRFCIVGAISFFINAGFTYLFHEVINIELLFATIFALLLTQFFQFPMSKEWAFQYKEKTKAKQFLYFIGSRIISLLIITVFTDLGTTLFNTPWILNQLFGVGFGMMFNFVVGNWLIFVEPENEDDKKKAIKQKKIFIYSVLFLLSIILGLIILAPVPVIITEDNLLWYLEGQNIIAHGGLPYFSWWHTPIYQYLVAFVIIIFKDNMLFLRVIQIIIYAICVCLVYATVCIKKDEKIALACAVIYMFSYTNLYVAHHIHQEGLVVLFILLTFYCFFRYEEQRKSIWLWAGMISVGLAFFTKETCIVVLGIYVVYVIFWVKPSMKELIISFACLSIFVIPFLIVQYLQDWKIIITYLGIGVEGSDSFLSRDGTSIFEKMFLIISQEPILYIFSFIIIGKYIFEFIRVKKVTSEYAIAFSVLAYNLLLLISRGSILHLSYVTFEMSYLAGLCVGKIFHLIKEKKSIFKNMKVQSPNKIIIGAIIGLLLIQSIILVPNLFLLRNMKQNKMDAYQEISLIVDDEVTYSETGDVLGYYVSNYYSPYSWYNSYKRDDFYSWDTEDVYRLTSMQNITDKAIKYFVYEDSYDIGEFYEDILTNGTLTLVKRIDYTDQLIWWIQPTEHYVELYTLTNP